MREDVKKIYDENRDIFFGFVVPHDEPNQPRKFYVYEWFTVSTDKVFYVGKGTGTRYKHILKEAEKSPYYKPLKDEFGIDSRIIVDKLTNEESEIMELYFIVQRLLENQPLLQSVIPWESGGLTERHFDEHIELMMSKGEDFLKYFK